MSIKILSKISFNLKYLMLFILLLSFFTKIETLSFTYPKAFSLTDGRIFVIHRLGIDICDSQYTTSERILSFSNPLTEANLSKISISKFSNGEFIIFIINKFYIFDANGNKKLETTTMSYSYSEYFTLSAHKITTSDTINTYYFLFGYIDNYNLYCNLFYYSIKSNSNSITTLDSGSFSDDIRFTGFRCEFSYYDAKDYFTCIYENVYDYSYSFTISLFYISGAEMYSNGVLHYSFGKIVYSQSTTISKESRSFFCGLDSSGKSFCFIYSAYDFKKAKNTVGYPIYYDDEYLKKCGVMTPYNIKTYYFPETGEYVFSCLTPDRGIQTTIYSKDMTVLSDIEKPSMRLQKEFSGCSEFHYSIIYSQ